jgi:hypothetical protein
MAFDRLRILDMTATTLQQDEYQLDLILQSPMLNSLKWEFRNIAVVKERIPNTQWPPLTKLDINSYLQDAELASILNRIGNGHGCIADLRLYLCEMNTRASSALSLHFNTLVNVDFGWKCASSSTIVDILCGCPRLEILQYVGSILAGDIASRGPWVCQQLRELGLWLLFEESEQDLHQLVFERLSTLTRLERLTILNTSRIEYENGLAFRFDCGLGRLASLQQLTDLQFGRDPSPQLSMEEVTWMVKNWKKLRRVKGCLHSDKRVRAILESVLESHGIDVQ